MAVLALYSCREEEGVITSTETPVAPIHEGEERNEEEKSVTEYLGLYVLCEGNMGSNKCTLDFLDFQTSTYHRNIYAERNPEVVMELGDVGNDIQIYGSRMWMVINCSNKVEVVDAYTTKRIGQVNIDNCRYVAFDHGYAYVSSYVGRSISKYNVLGSVYKVDTLTLEIVDKVDVGYQPEELAVVGNKLYVANSGGYRGSVTGEYDNRVSVIDLSTFTVCETIDVAPNLLRLRRDRYDQLWLTSRGIHQEGIPSRCYVLAKQEGRMKVVKEIDQPVSDLYFRGDSVYFYGSSLDSNGNPTGHTYGILHMKTYELMSDHFIQDGRAADIKTPYGLVVAPLSGDIYVMDATNYVSSGKLFRFDKHGNYQNDVWTGDIPGHAVFLTKTRKITE